MNTTILPDGSAFSTATIMSKEEAMKLPIKERPICFRLSSEMYHDTWEAIGAASMTFNASAGNEVLDSKKASEICVDLLFKIANEKELAMLGSFKAGMRYAAKMCDSPSDEAERAIYMKAEQLKEIPNNI